MADLTRICINGDCSDVPSGGGGGGAGLESITYAELVTKKNSGTLTPGGQYRITDYVCTTTQAESRAVSHPFDIIVFADDESTLNENARACLHEGDNYYSAEGHRTNLEAWELKYCIDNDENRFKWADSNGKGVVYWMKDDRGNECPYDFKQIQFKRYEITQCAVDSLIGSYTALEHGDVITAIDENNPIWCYTFSYYDTEAEEVIPEDASVMLMDAETGCNVDGNVIKPHYEYKDNAEWTGEYIYYLNNNIFFTTTCSPIESNILGDNCFSNTFGISCSYNTFAPYCIFNTFGDNCANNNFKNYCSSNVFGPGSFQNIFEYSCSSNAFGNGCNLNHLGISCENNTLGQFSLSNTFGIGCRNNTIGSGCVSNTIDVGSLYNIIGDCCSSNTFGKDCMYVDLQGGTSNLPKQYYHVLDGVQGTRGSHISITGTNGNKYATYVGKNSSNVLKTWVPADLAP